jgi:hypothetical protein
VGTLIKNKAALTLSFSKEMNGPLTQAIEKAVTKAFAEALKKNEVLTKANFAEALEENEVLTNTLRPASRRRSKRTGCSLS